MGHGLSVKCCLAVLFTAFFTPLFVPILRAQPPQRKIAFLVGIDDYFKKNLSDLQFAENDVTAVAAELEKLGFETTVLTGREATREQIQAGLNDFIETASQLESSDIVFAMFSGHGQELETVVEKRVPNGDESTVVKQVNAIPYFCARDAIPYDREVHLLRGKSQEQIEEEFKLVSFNRLIGDLNQRSNSLRNVLVVDACRNDPSKGVGKSANISGGTIRNLPTGLSVLFSAKSGQKSWESSNVDISHGVMTHFLIEGLKGGAADNGEITWSDLTSYVRKGVFRDEGRLAGDSTRTQTPHVISNQTGLLVLGRVENAGGTIAAEGSPEDPDSRNLRTVSNSIGMRFRLVPGGEFTMGSPGSEAGRSKDEFQHQVEIVDSYWMGTLEVTQKQWQTVMGTRPWDGHSPNQNSAAASQISWEDANEFCTLLSIKEGYAYRLPTEAEWERACRAGTNSTFSFGDAWDKLGEYAWNPNNSGNDAGEVGQKLPNQFGLYDMHGNVWEWCADWYDAEFYQISPKQDPTGPENGKVKVLRGGCFL